MTKKKIAIYPYIDECIVFSDFIDLIAEEYTFSEAAAPRSWGNFGKIIVTSYGNDTVKKSPKDFTRDNDILLIPEINIEPVAEDGIVKEIIDYIPSVKKIVYCACFTNLGRNKIIETCKKYNCEFEDLKDYSDTEDNDVYYSNLRRYLDSERHQKVVKCLIPCDVPIVAISGEWESTDKFPIQLKLLRSMKKYGYKVSMVGSSHLSVFFGAHNFPKIMFNTSVSEFDKPNIFSRYIYNISVEEEPDIMIVGIPGSAQAYNSVETNNFGILPFIAFQGIEPDYFIFSSTYREGAGELINELSKMCKYKYGVKPDLIHMSNISFAKSEFYNDTIVLQHEPRKNVNNVIVEEYGNDNGYIVNMMDQDAEYTIAEKIIEKLSSPVLVI